MATKPSNERLVKDSLRVLNNPFWIPELNTDELYARLRDDYDGTKKGHVMVQINQFGDIYIATDRKPGQFSRFRTSGGGGHSLRVRNALMLLALAIKLDNEEDPL